MESLSLVPIRANQRESARNTEQDILFFWLGFVMIVIGDK